MEEDRLKETFLEALDGIDKEQLLDRMRDYLKQFDSRLERLEHLEQQAPRDGLTGLFNRHCMETEYDRMIRNHAIISVLMLDIDYFKSVNDHFDQEIGDRVLQAVATFITDAAREDDACFRYGGEEFLLLLPGTNSDGARRFAERLRNVITRRTMEMFSMPITASFGIAECPRHSYQLDDLIRMADQALYQAKLNGRNRTVVYDAESAGALQSSDTLASPVSHLPQQSTPFLGRESELAGIADLLKKETCRLLTLAGPGGIGKTRLALEAASRTVEDYPYGAYFFPGSKLSSPEHLVSGLANSLNFSFFDDGDAVTQLLDYLREKKLLIVMDSFERFIDGGSRLLARMLEAAPRVKILVTSREKLGLKGERVLELEGMAVPKSNQDVSLTSADGFDAIDLFLHGSGRVYPGATFTTEEEPLVGNLCRFLEGMPLGIELASSWIRFLPLKDICAQFERSLDALSTDLGDVPECQRSLRVAFEYSWNLLKPEEKPALARMSVFRGGFRREAGEDVADAPLPLIAALMNKSLLRRSLTGRYEMHGVLRDYAWEKLREDENELGRVKDIFSNYYLHLLQDCEVDYLQARQIEAMIALEDEIENIREAWRMAVQGLRLEELNRSISALYLFYDIKAWLEEGEKLLGELVATVRASTGETRPHRRIEKEIMAKAVTRQGCLALRMGTYDKAELLLAEGLQLLRSLELKDEIAFNLIHSGMLSERNGDHTWASGLYREGLDIYRKLGDRRGVALALRSQAAHLPDGDKETIKLYRESLDIYRKLGDLRGTSITVSDLGASSFRRGEYEEAKRYFDENLGIARRLGDHWGIAVGLMNLGEVTGKLGQAPEARKLCRESLEVFREIGDRRGMAGTFSVMGQLAMDSGDFEEAARHFREALIISEELHAVPVSLSTMARMALLLEKKGKRGRSFEVVSCVLSQKDCDLETIGLGKKLRDRLTGELSAATCRKALARAESSSREDLVRDLLEKEYGSAAR